MAEPVLDALVLDHLAVSVGGEGAAPVRDVSLRLGRGATHVLLGESGCGKSMTLRSVLALHGPGTRVRGEVVVDGTAVGGLSASGLRDLRARTVGFVPQNPRHAFDPTGRIGAQLVQVIRLAERDPGGRRLGRVAARERATELLGLVGIPDTARVLRAYPHELSGGLAQRAAIAMALVGNPQLIVADEPTTALDMTVQAQILALFGKLRDELGTAILLVTHDIGVAEELGGRVSVMYAGRIVEQGPTSKVVADPVHPYTEALLLAQPRPGVRRGALASIPGIAPGAQDHHEGCAFAPRCALAQTSCGVRPDLVQVEAGHAVACSVRVPGQRSVPGIGAETGEMAGEGTS